MDPAWIALIGTLFGGIGLKAAEHFLGKSKVRVDDATRIRDELRTSIVGLREEIKELEDERDLYRNQYYDLRDKYIALQTELTLALHKIKQEANVATEIAQSVAKQPPPVDLRNQN